MGTDMNTIYGFILPQRVVWRSIIIPMRGSLMASQTLAKSMSRRTKIRGSFITLV